MKKLKTKRKNLLLTFIIILIIVLSFSLVIINYIGKKITPVLFKYSEIETKKFSNLIINNAISKTVTNKIKTDEIFIITNDDKNEIKTIDFNTPKINEYLTEVTKHIQEDMKNLEQGNTNKIDKKIKNKYSESNLKKGIIYSLSTGVVTNNPILSNLGPKIPIKINLIGDIISYVSADVEDYGINNSIIRVFINLKITEEVILPFYGKNIDIEAKVPVAIKLVTGKLPNYYIGTKESKQIVMPN